MPLTIFSLLNITVSIKKTFLGKRTLLRRGLVSFLANKYSRYFQQK